MLLYDSDYHADYMQSLVFMRQLTYFPPEDVVVILKSMVSDHTLWIKLISTCKIALKPMPQNDLDNSTLAQAMAWCYKSLPEPMLFQIFAIEDISRPQ